MVSDAGDLLPDVTDDERAIGWGDDLADGLDGEQVRDDRRIADRRDDEWYRRERPPHWE